MNPADIALAVRRHLLPCLIIVVVLVAAGAAAYLSTSPTATASAEVVLEPGATSTSSSSGSSASSADRLQTSSYQLTSFTLSAIPTLVQLSTSPAVMEPAAKELGIDASTLSSAVYVSNPTETLILSVKATASTRQEAVDRVNATITSLTDGLASGDLLGETGTLLTPSVATPASVDGAVVSRSGAKGVLIAAAVVGVLLALLYAVWAESRSRRLDRDGAAPSEAPAAGAVSAPATASVASGSGERGAPHGAHAAEEPTHE